MDTLEIHSKDFLVKWIHAVDNSSIVWQVKPLKKSINFSIYKRATISENDSSNDNSATHDDLDDDQVQESTAHSNGPLNEQASDVSRLRSGSVASVNQITQSNSLRNKSRSTTFSNSLNGSNLVLVKDYYKLVPGELVRGHFNVEKEGMYAFIFDNSFSKAVSKKVLFSAKLVSNVDTSSIPVSEEGDHLREPSGVTGDTSGGNRRMQSSDGEVMMTTFLKRRRKKLQGFTKRTFVLDLKYSTLSYFKLNDNKLRGQMPIIHSIVSANAKTREIFIDSGMEVWDLKALNQEDFEAWVDAFDKVKKGSYEGSSEKPTSFKPIDGSTTAGIPQLSEINQQLTNLLKGSHNMSRDQLEFRLQEISTSLQYLTTSKSQIDGELTPVLSNSEFFDAEETLETSSRGVVLMDGADRRQQSEDDDEEEHEESDSSSDSDSEDLPAPSVSKADATPPHEGEDMDGPLYPLPLDPITRDPDIPVCDHEPPNLLSFVRKNVGKDLSSIAMPVSMNEPINILQKYAEQLEYSEMIDNALDGTYPEDSGELILRIAAFAVSNLSSFRKKVRSIRKPFNPLLGETFELVREDKGFRLISEKVSHKPPVFAVFAESDQWAFGFSASPSQKFWGKTYEVSTKGTMKLSIKSTGEVFTWSQPTSLLKNIIAGEKYTEPSSSIVIKSSSGQKAVVDFTKGGMFSGRSEDLTIKAYNSAKKQLPYTVVGKWTESMVLKTNNTEKEIWTAGNLLPQCEKKFGFTEFAGTLNKITSIEKNNLPPCDSRLRPDMRAYEVGDVSKAEELKIQLEEDQRSRRAEMESAGKTHKPLFFKQVGDTSQADTGEWIYDAGVNSYWNRRSKQNWSGVQSLW
ncbi:uncharacterized protein CXQ87_005198 [Candidozyma duobushaemuli]|uniref:PH domain-containing protein n=2 Tax=Candidozyma TaxID=3303203 RepID=A0ABX8I9P7_9ASCO|nr:uncharacterized protein CXQ87_005198 [[Candida] duobushaemulonis]PVH14920.1 hypothetical protein CXQ87_005198 [[Candida] duobushaemulonis]QWU90004.1 hypothetical protein CA3LBN_004362 [[Candida] haemuloni]